MLNSKLINLMPIIRSNDGVHLSVYLVNRGDLVDLKYQLRDAIQESYEWLSPVMSVDDREHFLSPLDALLDDDKILKDMKSNVAIFRNQDHFRLVSVPVPVEKICQIATSFHVKPLLKWLQNDQDFLLLGIQKDAAYLYLGNQSSLRLIDSLIFPKANSALDSKDETGSKVESGSESQKFSGIAFQENFESINNWIFRITRLTKPKLFLAGEEIFISELQKVLKYRNTVKVPAAKEFDRFKANRCCRVIRSTLKEESRRTFEKSLMEFHIADESNRTRRNVFQIARAVVRGEVKKLIVTDEINIFGKVDRSSGVLALHPYDLDHEDDDILDDLAQIVLSQGGEVLVASLKQIPNGRPILAILENDNQCVEKFANQVEVNAV